MAKHRSEMPRSGTTQHIHNHSPNPAISIVAIAVVVLIGIFLAWHAGIYLLDLAGAHRPKETMAQIIIWGVPLLLIGWLLTLWGEHILDRVFEHNEAMEDKRTEQLRYKQLMLKSAVTDTRATGEDARLNALILAIMMDSYDHLARNNTKYFGANEKKPWSRRQAGAQVLVSMGETEPVGETMGVRARAWLEEREIIVNDQVNLDRYPNLASVQRLLYAPPLVRSPYLPSSGEEGPEWNIIENT